MGTWSASETDTLIRMWPTASAAQIAQRLHRPRQAVCSKAKRLRHDGVLPADVDKHFEVNPRPGRERRDVTVKTNQPTAGALQMEPCALRDLDEGRCHWPLGLLHEVATLFCGGVTEAGRRYCAHHRLRARLT